MKYWFKKYQVGLAPCLRYWGILKKRLWTRDLTSVSLEKIYPSERWGGQEPKGSGFAQQRGRAWASKWPTRTTPEGPTLRAWAHGKIPSDFNVFGLSKWKQNPQEVKMQFHLSWNASNFVLHLFQQKAESLPFEGKRGTGGTRDKRRQQGFLLNKSENQQRAAGDYICRDIYRIPQTPTAWCTVGILGDSGALKRLGKMVWKFLHYKGKKLCNWWSIIRSS